MTDSSGSTVGKLTGLSKSDVENIYATAVDFLTTLDYAKAATLFTVLAWIDGGEVEYWVGLGIAQQALGMHAKAIKSLGKACELVVANETLDDRPMRLMSASLQVLGYEKFASRASEVATIASEMQAVPKASEC
ncbi:hypothetical protein PQR05_36430 [Paraburkholderia sediminicola]|uniref:hypothetical protein n=1 Tax=Paraburkholderia sediminicola TaxID=458836 RepID=UPI0038BB821F